MITRTESYLDKAFTKLVYLRKKRLAALPRPREGFTRFAKGLFELWAEHADALHIEGLTPEAALAELEAYDALLAREREARGQLKMIVHTRVLRAASIWSAMLDVYAWARSIGRNDPGMVQSVSGFARFMRHKPHKKRVAPVATT